MQEFGILVIYTALSFIFGVCMLICSILVAPKTKNKEKESIYECGINVSNSTPLKFNIQFLIYAILFLIFDIETLFIFPFAISFNYSGIFIFIETLIFISLLLLGLIYAIKKGMLRFKQ